MKDYLAAGEAHFGEWPGSSEEQAVKVPEKKQLALGLSESLGSFMILGGHNTASTPSSALRLYQTSTAVAMPIDLIADTGSVIDIGLQVGDELITEHDVLTFLKQPSPFYDQELFLNVLLKDYLAVGEAHFVALGNVKFPPVRLQPISPAMSSPSANMNSDAPSVWIVSGNELPGAYVADVFAKEVRYFLKDSNLRELEIIRNYSPRNNSLLRGQSLLVAASREVRSHVLGTEHNVSLLENGGRVSLVFNFEDMGDQDWESTKDELLAKYAGASRAGTIAVTAGGKMSVEELGKTPKDMDFESLQNMVSKAVALRYKVPLPLISDERQTLNNYEVAILALYDQAVLPTMRKILGGVGNLLLPRYGLDPRLARLVPIQDSVTALVIRRNAELAKRRVMNLETINELRAQIGREEIEGGDELYQPATFVPLGTDLFTDDNDPAVNEPVLGGSSDKPDTDPEANEEDETPAPDASDEDEE